MLTRGIGVAGLAAIAACASTSAPPRRQVLVVIDTDALSPEDVARDPELSGALTVDSVRVDVLDEKDGVRVFREFSAVSRLDWPFSFELRPPERGELLPTTLRVRAFRARDAQAALEGTQPTLAPMPELALDRVVVIPAPAPEEVIRLRIDLNAECMGTPTSFRDRTSCVDGEHPMLPFAAALPRVGVGAETTSRVGTTALGRAVPCARPAAPGRVCIPGGLSVLGSAQLAGTEDGIVSLSPLPMRLVRVAPFLMDETELTVGAARPLLAGLHSEQPVQRSGAGLEASKYCTLESAPLADLLPLNCVGDATARELCALRGGTLPTEAQWNHAATGRGEGRRYPWGDRNNGCCNVSAGRLNSFFANQRLCQGEGVEPVGSHLPSSTCQGQGDVSRDGVVDLGGSLAEVLSDNARPLDDACWGPRFGILVDPTCVVPGSISIATRGGDWAAGTFNAAAAQRGAGVRSVGRGVRCVYRGAAE